MKAEKEKDRLSKHLEENWTFDPITRRFNSSEKYNAAVADVNQIIRESARALLNGDSKDVAGHIVSYLTGVHGLAPVEETKTANLTLRHGLAPSKDTKKNKKTG